MAKQISQKKPIVLFIVWILSGIAFVFYNIFKTKGMTTQENGLNIVITLAVTATYFIPMLFVIYRQARIVEIKWLFVIARILFFYLCGVFVAFLVALLLM